MRIAEVELERMYWRKVYVTPVKGLRFAEHSRGFSGWHVLCRVLVEYKGRGRLHIIRFEWRMNERRQWRLWGIPDTCTAASLVGPVDA